MNKNNKFDLNNSLIVKPKIIKNHKRVVYINIFKKLEFYDKVITSFKELKYNIKRVRF